jgi:hypothetical protein
MKTFRGTWQIIFYPENEARRSTETFVSIYQSTLYPLTEYGDFEIFNV